MHVYRTVSEFRAARRHMPGPVGVVPTMGFLHEGHLSLVRASRAADASVVATIFVNPTQFGPNEDFARYPRDEARDLRLLAGERVDAVFAPSVEEMYPAGFATFVQVEGLTEVLEGAHRPGHFRGVTTVVAKLFEIIQPDRAYFGQKDAQQLVVIRRMVRDLDMPVEIIGLPTVREPDGLAMSSRNAYLSPRERRAATVLYRALLAARTAYDAGERRGDVLRQVMLSVLAGEPLARVDYVSIADLETLRELGEVREGALASLAVRIGPARLIDNFVLGGEGRVGEQGGAAAGD